MHIATSTVESCSHAVNSYNVLNLLQCHYYFLSLKQVDSTDQRKNQPGRVNASWIQLLLHHGKCGIGPTCSKFILWALEKPGINVAIAASSSAPISGLVSGKSQQGQNSQQMQTHYLNLRRWAQKLLPSECRKLVPKRKGKVHSNTSLSMYYYVKSRMIIGYCHYAQKQKEATPPPATPLTIKRVVDEL